MAFPNAMIKGDGEIDPRLNLSVPPGGDGGHANGGDGTDNHTMCVRLVRISHEPWSKTHGRMSSGSGTRDPKASPHVKTNRNFYK